MTGELGIGRFVVARVLNHIEKDITSVYDRHSYDREKRQALDAWGEHLSAILSKSVDTSEVVEQSGA